MSLSEKLIIAAKKGNAREVRKLLGRGAHFTKDQFGNTALHEAAWNGCKDIVKSLLGAYCFVDSINNSGFTPLHLASQNGHAKVAKTLLKWKTDPCLLNQHGETALHLVAKYNHACVVSAFAFFRVPMDMRGKDGNTALHIAAKLGNIEVMKSLLHHGADPTVANMRGLKALDYAETGNYKDCSKLIQSALLKRKSKPVHYASNEYSSALKPTARKRADTYDQSPVKLERKKTSKDGISLKQPSPSYKLKLKKGGGYFADDDGSADQQVFGQRYFSSSQEAPDSFSYGGGGGGGGDDGYQTPSPSHSKSASIDQLLNEMEREYYGPGYKYTPPPQDRDKGLITPYAEIWQIKHPRSSSMDSTHPSCPLNGKTHIRSFSQEHYDLLKPSKSHDKYDMLTPNPTQNPTPTPTHFTSYHSRNDSEDYAHIDGSPLRRNPRIRTDARSSYPDKSSSESPSRSSHHKTKGLMGRQQILRTGEQEDTDTYVYMAPVADFSDVEVNGHVVISGGTGKGVDHEAESGSEVSIQMPDVSTSSDGSSENGSRNSKRAIICNSPMQADRKHEPNTSLEPVKGILSQSSVGDSEQSQLERYLQEELETMRQAFQIRLGQLERRYQRQLVMEQNKNHASSSGATRRRRKNLLSSQQTFSSQRRNSWHSYISSEEELDKLAQPDEPRSGSSLGIDSDHSLGGSDAEEWNEIEVLEKMSKKKNNKSVKIARDSYDSHGSVDSCLDELPKNSNHKTSGQKVPDYAKLARSNEGGLKGGARSWRDGSPKENGLDVPPQLLPDNNEMKDEVSIADRVAKELIQQKIEEYRHKMMKYFQEKSEAQITVIEEKYQKQIDEVRRKYSEKASRKSSDRIKDLENSLDMQTLV